MAPSSLPDVYFRRSTNNKFRKLIKFGEVISSKAFSLFLSRSLQYWLNGPCCLTVSCLGLLTNTVALVMLGRERVHRTFHLLMMFLSMWDLAYLVLIADAYGQDSFSLRINLAFLCRFCRSPASPCPP